MADPLADANAQVIGTFRANAGVVGGPFEGKRLVLLQYETRTSRKFPIIRLEPVQ